MLPFNSLWRYMSLAPGPSGVWFAPGYNDATWPSGTGALGYGQGTESTVIPFGPDPNNKPYTAYFRSTFTHPGGEFSSVSLRFKADDGAVVYLNGVEVARDNLPVGQVYSWTKAVTARTGADEEAIREFIVPTSSLVSGQNTVAVELHQNYRTTSDAIFDLEIKLN